MNSQGRKAIEHGKGTPVALRRAARSVVCCDPVLARDHSPPLLLNRSEAGESLTLGFSPPFKPVGCASSTALAEMSTFLPGLVENYFVQQGLPTKENLAVLFVDIADSTRTLLRLPPEGALAVVQRFMNIVTEIALAHGGDVKDYEGDGALLYFGSVTEATQAGLAIRTALAAARNDDRILLQARLSLNVGDVVIGVIGSPRRRSVALIGPTVSLASRLLKHIPPGGIIAPQEAIEKLRREAPVLARQFTEFGKCLTLKGFEEECVTAYHIPSLAQPAAQQEFPRSVTENSSPCNVAETAP